MRSLKQLFQVMLEHQNLFQSGMCQWIFWLHCKNIISTEERNILVIYIKNHRPITLFYLLSPFHDYHDYYWQPKNIKPRVRWIKKQIKKLK